MVSPDQLKQLHIGEQWVDALNETFQRFNILTPLQQASFIGQCGHECGNFKILEENLNYRAETLMKLWKSRFPTIEIANEYARNPKKIANKVYASRMGNRDESSGDGFRFRGRGCIQLTGHANYFHAGQACGEDFVMNPDLVATHKLNKFADIRDFTMMTKKINGGTIGLNDRIKHINHALEVLNG
jgi:putative chitinase